jgi:hypothetical protein
MAHKAIIKCEFIAITTEHGGQRLRCNVEANTLGYCTITSELKLVDFERKFAVTQNNIYDWS